MSPSIPAPWPHQSAACNAAELAMAAGRESGLIVLPCGCGKTAVVLTLGRRLRLPMLFLVNQDELLGQTVLSAARFWPEAHVTTIEADGPPDWDAPDLLTGRKPDLVVAMVPTLLNRLDRIDPERFAVVVPDEAHRSVSPTWRKVIGHFKAGFRLGLTATPQRLDGKGLADLYGREPLYSYSLFQAIKDKRLVPINQVQVQTGTDLDDLDSAEGEDGESDFKQGQLGPRVNNHARNDLIVAAYLRHAKDRRAVAFCVDVAHAQDLALAFIAAGVRAVAVTGRMKAEARRRIFRDFKAGAWDVVTNCEVCTTGYDDQGLSCLLMGRPTESRSLLIQMTGRALRLHGATWEESVAAGKKDALLIDFTDNCTKHKLVSVLDLLGKKKPLENGPTSSRTPPVSDPYRQGQLPLQSLVSWSLKSVCPWPEMPSIDGYVPTLSWHNDRASEGQLRFLASFGLAPTEQLSKGEASFLIDRAMEYDAVHPVPATPWQQKTLAEHGLWTDGMGKRQARALIESLRQKERREQLTA